MPEEIGEAVEQMLNLTPCCPPRRGTPADDGIESPPKTAIPENVNPRGFE